MNRISRRVLGGLLALEVLGIAWLVLSPTAVAPSTVVLHIGRLMRSLGLPRWLADAGLIEFTLNVALFVPLAALCALLWTRPKVWMWILGGFLLSSGLEWLQLEFLSGRSSTSRDIIANTLGTILGAGTVCSLRWWREVALEDLAMGGRGS